MAKVVITLEDTTEADGTEGITIDWSSPEEDYDEDSLAHAYAAAFVQSITNQAGRVEIIDKDTAEILTSPTTEDDPTLN